VALVAAVAAAAPLVFDLLPLPKVPPMVTEIIAGLLIGPHVLDIAQVDEPVEVLSQIGLVFLFFLAGLEIAFTADTARNLRLVLLGFAGSLALALVVAHLFDAIGLVEAPLLVAIVLAATAFGIVVAVLSDAHETRSGFGQLVIAAASVADFGTVILLSLFFSGKGTSVEATIALLAIFGAAVAILGLALWRARAWTRLAAAVTRMQETTAQIGVRIAFVLLIALVLMADEFGLEVVLGAFLAGAMVSFLDREDAVARTGLKQKLEGAGFGVFIPVFFVASGMRLNLEELFESAASVALVPAVIAALLLVRALPALVYREQLGTRGAFAAGLLQATSLPFIVAATQIGVELDKISEATAAGLVAGGVLSVLLFPAVAMALLKEDRWSNA
jgi:Kef-type K+ transport system membrane component KefB